ncbi:MAG TPA: hypothetical protein VHO43_01315 [Ignavibacteriales bacterium]|nr:hypothetical protein [Ignavibacteriales bacterium]
MRKLYSVFILLLAVLLISSCSKEEKNSVEPEGNNDKAPGLPNVAFKGPNTQSTDQYAIITKTSVESFNTYPLLINSIFSAVQPTSSNGEWKWVVNPGGTASETFTGKRNSDGSYTWALILNGTIQNDSYSNWKAFEGTTSADGKSGNWKIFDENSTTLVGEYSWSTNASGILTGILLEYDNGAASGKMEVINNPDNSGSLKIYHNNVLELMSTWKTDGTGTWHSYENGVEKTNGNWQ